MSNPFSSARNAWNTFVEYPGWLESLFGIVGGVLFTVWAISATTPLTDRPGLQMTTRYMGDAFALLGALLAAFHAYALMTYNRDVRRGLALGPGRCSARPPSGRTSWARSTCKPSRMVGRSPSSTWAACCWC